MSIDWLSFWLGSFCGAVGIVLAAAFAQRFVGALARLDARIHRAFVRRRNSPLPTVDPWQRGKR